MKKRNSILALSAALAAITLSAYQSSPATSGAGNRTGAAGSTANCSSGGCHAASSSATTVDFVVTKPSTPTVPETSYTPGVMYNVTLTGKNVNAKPKFGFQIAATNVSGVSVGTINALTSSHAVHTAAGIKILEHTAPQNGPGGAYLVDFTWVAPPAGTGKVTFYGIMNAVNGDGSTGGDEPSFGITKVLAEATSAIGEQAAASQLQIVPNPASDRISLKGLNQPNAKVAIFSANGAVVLQTQTTENIDISGLAAGSYVLQLQTDQQISSSVFNKQ